MAEISIFVAQSLELSLLGVLDSYYQQHQQTDLCTLIPSSWGSPPQLSPQRHTGTQMRSHSLHSTSHESKSPIIHAVFFSIEKYICILELIMAKISSIYLVAFFFSLSVSVNVLYECHLKSSVSHHHSVSYLQEGNFFIILHLIIYFSHLMTFVSTSLLTFFILIK